MFSRDHQSDWNTIKLILPIYGLACLYALLFMPRGVDPRVGGTTSSHTQQSIDFLSGTPQCMPEHQTSCGYFDSLDPELESSNTLFFAFAISAAAYIGTAIGKKCLSNPKEKASEKYTEEALFKPEY